MRYKNIRTGAIIDSPFVIDGEDWILVENELESDEINSQVDPTDNDSDNPVDTEGDPVDTEDNGDDDSVIDLRTLTKKDLIKFAEKEQIQIDSTKGKKAILDDIIEHLESNEESH